MKRSKRCFILFMVCLLLLQTMSVINVQGQEMLLADTTPISTVTPALTMPPLVIVQGSIKTEIYCSQETESLIKAGFTIVGGYRFENIF